MSASLPRRRLILLSTLLLLTLGPATGLPEPWRAGVAKVNITPPQPMWMAGYASRNRPADGKLTDLWAKALVLQNPSGSRAALVTLDLIGVDRGLAACVCNALECKHGLRRSEIAICCSHTHTGPVVAGALRPLHYLLLDDQQRSLADQYAGLLKEKIVQVVGEATARMEPAQLASGYGRTTFAVNRRENPEANVPALRGQGRLKGPSDHDVPVLTVRHPDGRLVAVAFGYACHATVLDSYQWSGDYPGFAQIELEQAHPGSIALFVAGCGADQNPLPRRSVDLAQQYGRQLAAAVASVLAGAMLPVGDGLLCRYREVDLPLAALPTADDLNRDAEAKDTHVASRARMLLAQIADGNSLSPSYPYPVQTWRLGGELQMVFLGGEVVVDYALRVKAAQQGPRTWLAGYANDLMGYIPSRRVLAEGGYEGGDAAVYYGLPTVWAPEVEDTVVREVDAQLASEP